MNANPVGWFEIYVDDIDRARTFYETVFEVKLENLLAPDESQMWAFPMAQEGSGAAGSLVYMNGVKAGGNSTIVYFSSEDCSIEEARVEDAGGSVFKSKFSIGDYGFITLAFDTERNMFGIHSRQ
jgi:predicted enzyme related to lactoylglutathione lyase